MRSLPERTTEQPRICLEGRNCWQILPTNRVAFLIDGAAYFAAVAAAAELAQESIVIVGWDLHSQVRLVRDGQPHDFPAELRAFLRALIARRRDLHVYILVWDYAMIYALEREVLPLVRKDWRAGVPSSRGAAYLVGSLVLFPITLLIVATVVLAGPVLDVLYAFAGCLSGAMLTYGVGAWLGRDVVRHFAGSRVNRLSQRLAQHGVLAMVIVRVIPVAPFTIVNMVAGASHIAFRDFVVGTALGMGPGILVISLFARQLESVMGDPALDRVLLLVGLTLLIGVAAIWMHRWLAPRNRRHRQHTVRPAMRLLL